MVRGFPLHRLEDLSMPNTSVSNACPCAPLPLESQTAASFTDVIPVRAHPLDACAGNYITRYSCLISLIFISKTALLFDITHPKT